MGLDAAREHIEKLEKELYKRTIDISNKNPKISKESFLNAQKKSKLYNVIDSNYGKKISETLNSNCHDEIKSDLHVLDDMLSSTELEKSRLITNKKKKKTTKKDTDGKSNRNYVNLSDDELSSESSDYHTKTLSKEQENIFYVRLLDERQRIESEFRENIKKLEMKIDELTHKRVCDKEKYRNKIDELDSIANEMKSANRLLEEKNRGLKIEINNVQIGSREVRSENEKLQRDIERMEDRLQHEKSAISQLEGRFKAESEIYNRKLEDYESQVSEYKEQNIKLKARNDNLNKKVQTLEEAVFEYERKLATEKATSAKNTDELKRLSKKYIVFEDESNITIKNLQLRIAELENQIYDLVGKLETAASDYNAQKNYQADLETEILELKNDCKNYKNVKESYENCKLKLAALNAEMSRSKTELSRLSTELQGSNKKIKFYMEKADSAEADAFKYKRELETVSAHPRTQRVILPRQNTSEELVDIDGVPISRLKNKNNSVFQTSPNNLNFRPDWWNTTNDQIYPSPYILDDSINFNENHRIKKKLSDLHVLDSHDFSGSYEDIKTKSDLYVLGPNESLEKTEIQPMNNLYSAIKILRDKEEEIIIKMKKLAPNPAYRTTEENEHYDELKCELEKIRSDIDDLKSIN